MAFPPRLIYLIDSENKDCSVYWCSSNGDNIRSMRYYVVSPISTSIATLLLIKSTSRIIGCPNRIIGRLSWIFSCLNRIIAREIL